MVCDYSIDSGTGDDSDLFKFVVDHINSEEVQKLENSHQLLKFTSERERRESLIFFSLTCRSNVYRLQSGSKNERGVL